MASAHPIFLKNGIAWRIAYRLNGKQYNEYVRKGIPYRKHQKKHPREIQAIVAEFNRRLARHHSNLEEFTSPLKRQRSEITVVEFRDWFLENKKYTADGERAISPRTIEDYVRAFRILKDAVGNIPINMINLNKLREALVQYSTNTKNTIIENLKHAGNFGVDNDIIDFNPFAELKRSKIVRLPDYLSVDELNRIFSNIKNIEGQKAFLVGRYAGLRRREMVVLKWIDIWWDQNIINIPTAKINEFEKAPLIPRLKSELSRYNKRNEFVINLSPGGLGAIFCRAKKCAGIYKRGSVHILRHSLATNLINQGVDIKFVKKFLRHAQKDITDIYLHITLEDVIRAVEGKTL